ncbi:MAG: right-handed parallel beta-helix repeat-containing protein [Kiritimatiellae bacterium]|nr:right-handed parallel beta-helix repeat-containing protein [Kiritimatiellia bacterium]
MTIALRAAHFVALCLAAAVRADAETTLRIHVATNGLDRWSGRSEQPLPDGSDGPVATVGRALMLLSSLPDRGEVVIQFGPGVWELPATVELTAQHSGGPGRPMTIRGTTNGATVWTGGRRVQQFHIASNGIWVADLRRIGWTGAPVRMVVWGGRRLPMARTPNGDAAAPHTRGWMFANGTKVSMHQELPGELRDRCQYRAEDAPAWREWQGAEIVVFPRYNWWNDVVRVKSVEVGQRRVLLERNASYAIRPGDRYYLRGVRSALDAPGEWWHEAATDRLWMIPPEAVHPDAAPPVRVGRLATLLAFRPGASWIRVERIRFECAQSHAVLMHGATQCVVAACTVRSAGDHAGHGIGIWEGLSNVVFGCDISEVGASGVSVGGGDRISLRGGAHTVENCYIHHVGLEYAQGVGVSVAGVGHRIAHNLIHDGPRMGIMYSGNNLRIEFNRIRHMNLDTSDTGGTYTAGRDWISSRGTLLRHNFIHDMFGLHAEGECLTMPGFAFGIYQDDNAGGVDIIGNVVLRCSRAALMLHNARDTRIVNNIFVDCGERMLEYNGWTPEHSYWAQHLRTMITGYESVATSAAWRSMRNMQVHPTNAPQPDGTIMTGNELVRNIIAWRGTNTALFRFRHLPRHAYRSDSNVVWGFGAPIRTGYCQVRRERAEVPLSNAVFAAAPDGRLPGWRWQASPSTTVTLRSVGGTVSGGVARLTGGAQTNKDASGRVVTPILISEEVELTPGRVYRLSVRARADRADRRLALRLQTFRAGEFFWVSDARLQRLTTEWARLEALVTTPSPGDGEFRPGMTRFRVRFDFPEADGFVELAVPRLVECEVEDEWASWRALGFDSASVVADPLFEDLDGDNFRLKPQSPAFQLGFEPIPMERIGPYAHPLRASWPIVEVTGAREYLGRMRIER